MYYFILWTPRHPDADYYENNQYAEYLNITSALYNNMLKQGKFKKYTLMESVKNYSLKRDPDPHNQSPPITE